MSLTEEEEELAIKVLSELEERLVSHDRNRREVQDRLNQVCDDLRQEVEKMAIKVNSDLEILYNAEEIRLQTLVSDINKRLNTIYSERNSSAKTSTSTTTTTHSNDHDKHKHKHKHKKHIEEELTPTMVELRNIVTRAEVELQTEQIYKLREPELGAELSFTDLYKLEGRKQLIVRDIQLRGRKPHNVKVKKVRGEHIYMKFHDIFSEEEALVLKGSGLDKLIDYRVLYHEDGTDIPESPPTTPSTSPRPEMIPGPSGPSHDHEQHQEELPSQHEQLPPSVSPLTVSSGSNAGTAPLATSAPSGSASTVAAVIPLPEPLTTLTSSGSGTGKRRKRHNKSITAYLLHAWREPTLWRHEQLLTHDDHSFVPIETLKSDTTYRLKMRVEYAGSVSDWSKETLHTTPSFSELCGWQECKEGVFASKKYAVSPENPRVVRSLYTACGSGCAVVGRAALPSGKTTAWKIKILGSHSNDGAGLEVGIAPFDVGKDDGCAHGQYGWYLRCEDFTLWSGPPHNFRMRPYALKKTFKEKAKVGCEVGVSVDMLNGSLGFEVNGKNLGTAYEAIPMNKPIVPVVVLSHRDDSVEIIPC